MEPVIAVPFRAWKQVDTGQLGLSVNIANDRLSKNLNHRGSELLASDSWRLETHFEDHDCRSSLQETQIADGVVIEEIKDYSDPTGMKEGVINHFQSQVNKILKKLLHRECNFENCNLAINMSFTGF